MTKQRAMQFTRPVPRPITPAEGWTIQFTPVGHCAVPPICRVRKLLKMALRTYRLKATVVAQSPAVTPPGDQATIRPSEEPETQPRASNEAAFYKE